ncbi:unnamed protein product, partial [Ixodes pacificus]
MFRFSGLAQVLCLEWRFQLVCSKHPHKWLLDFCPMMSQECHAIACCNAGGGKAEEVNEADARSAAGHTPARQPTEALAATWQRRRHSSSLILFAGTSITCCQDRDMR